MKIRGCAGAGGSWPIIAENLNDSTVVKQATPDSCVAACGEMLSQGNLSQSLLIGNIGAPAPIESLKPELGSNWRAGYVRKKDLENLILRKNKSLGAAMNGRKLLHAVVVDGMALHNNVAIRDPWHPSSYEMSAPNFHSFCTGIVVFEI
jgi:hypothetical protein